MHLRVLMLCAALPLALTHAQGLPTPEVHTVEPGERQRLWLGVLTTGDVYLRVANAEGNCANFYWQYAGIFKRKAGRLCNSATLRNYVPVASLWIDRPATRTLVALSDNARSLDWTGLCALGFPCPSPVNK